MSRRKPLPTTHRLAFGPDFANSSRFHSTPFQRRPVNHSTGPRFHSTPLHRLKSPKTGRPRRHERASFRQVPSAGRPRIRVLPKLPPSQRPQNQSDLWPVQASRGPYACPPPTRRRPPSHPAARSRNSTAPPPRPQQPPVRPLPDRPIGKGPGSRPLA
jgi:hypothetical protein